MRPIFGHPAIKRESVALFAFHPASGWRFWPWPDRRKTPERLGSKPGTSDDGVRKHLRLAQKKAAKLRQPTFQIEWTFEVWRGSSDDGGWR